MLGQQARLGQAPARWCWEGLAEVDLAQPSLPVMQELDRRVFLPARRRRRRLERHEVLVEDRGRPGDVQRGEELGVRAEVDRQRPRAVALGQRRPPGAEQRDVGVAEAVDRLELVADREQVLGAKRSTMRSCSGLVSWNSSTMTAEAPGPAVAHGRVVEEAVARELEVGEVDGGTGALGRGVVAGERRASARSSS